MRDLVGDPVEVLQLEVHAGLAGDGQQVQHRIGGAPKAMVTAMAFSKAFLVRMSRW